MMPLQRDKSYSVQAVLLLLIISACLLTSPGAANAADTDGLWVGTATLTNVTDLNVNVETPTTSALMMRLLLHQGGGGVKLLKQVYLVKSKTLGVPVLLTDDGLLPKYDGVVMRDNTMVGQRISTVGYDFAGNEADCTGALASGSQVICEVGSSVDASNPFLHRYHPDHGFEPDNSSSPSGAIAVSRTIELEIDSDLDIPGYGESVLSGTYFDTITGLHKSELTVSGTFELQRIAEISELTSE